MQLIRRVGLAIAGAACCVGLLAGLARHGRAVPADRHRPRARRSCRTRSWISAVQLGYFEREGVDVELVRVQQTPSAIAALQAGEGEMANISVDAALQLVGPRPAEAEGGRLAEQGAAVPDRRARRRSLTPQELEGRSFGIGRVGSLDHSLSTQGAAGRRASIPKLNFVAIGQPNVRAQALAAGQVDATTMSIGVWMSLPDKTGLHVLVDQDAYYEAAPVRAEGQRRHRRSARRPGATRSQASCGRSSQARATSPTNRRTGSTPWRRRGPTSPREDLESWRRLSRESWSVNGGLNSAELEFTAEWAYQSPDFEGVRAVQLDRVGRLQPSSTRF